MGANFADYLLLAKSPNLKLNYLPELEDRFGQERAKDLHLAALSLKELSSPDLETMIFDFCQDSQQKERLLERLSAKQKKLIVNSKLTQMIWSLISKERISADSIAELAI